MAGKFSLEAVFKAIDRFSAPVSKMEAKLTAVAQRFSRNLREIDKVNAKVSEGLGQAALMAGGAGIAIGAVGHNVAETGMQFENAIAAVGAVSLMTRKEIEPLEREARRLGDSIEGFGFTATQVAGAMELLGKAGFDNNQILQATPGLLAAAAAEGADLAEVAGLVSNTLKGMGMATSETTRVADVLTLASARTNSSISSLGESMAIASSTAKQFKVPFEEAVAAVALLQDVGLDASTAGTAVSTMLTKLAAPSKEARQEMAALGIKFEDLHGNMLPLPQIFAQFAKAADKSGGNMKSVAFFADLVGLRGEKAALNLKDLFTSGKFGDLTKDLEGAAGSAQKMAKLRMDTVTGDLKLLSNTIDDVKISLFDANSGGLRGVIQGTTQWVNANKELIRSRVQDTIVAIVTHLPEIWLWTKRIAFGIVVFYAWQLAVKAAAVATFLFEVAVGAAGAAATALGFVIGLLTVATDADTLAAIASTAWTWLRNAALVAYNAVVWLGVAAMAAYGFMTGNSTAQMVLSNAIFTVLRAGFIVYNAIVGIATALLAAYNAGTLLSTIRQGALVAVVWLAVAAQTALNAVMAINPMFLLGAGILLLIGLVLKLSGAWDWLKSKVAGFGESVMAKIQPVIDKVTALWEALKKAGKLIGGFIGVGGGEQPGSGAAGTGPILPGDTGTAPILTPSDAVANSVQQQITTTKAELTIRDQTGRGELTEKPTGSGFKISLDPSGGFTPATP